MSEPKHGFDKASPDTGGHGVKPTLKWLPVSRLSVDMAYQRSLESERSKKLIANIAGGFEWALFGVVTVAPLPLGSYELMDGQHRVAGARAAGIEEVPASIIEAPTIEQRARIFRAANSQRVAMHQFALYHAAVLHKDPAALAIAGICSKADVEVLRYPLQRASMKPNQTMALGALKKLAAEQSPAGAIRTLKILRAAFPNDGGVLQAHLIVGLRHWIREHAAADDLAVANALQQYGLDRFERRIFSIGLAGNRRFEAVQKVLVSIVPAAAIGRSVREAPTEATRKAAFTPMNQDLLDRAKHFKPSGFDPSRMQRKAAPAAPMKGRK